MNFIKPALAQIDLGPIKGVGKFQTGAETGFRAGQSLEQLISAMIGALTAIAGVAFLIYFLLGGLTWITAGGDKQKTEKAQKQMTDSLIGLVAVVVAYFIAGIVSLILGLDIPHPASVLFPVGQ